MGYEGLQVERFFDLLVMHGIETLVDIRENPISRKRGFSKNALMIAAAERGLKYRHFPTLGSPKEVRQRYRADGDWETFTAHFTEYLMTQDEDIAALAALAARERSCLLCFEADPCFCHRLFVAQRVVASADPATSVIHHLTPQGREPFAQPCPSPAWAGRPIPRLTIDRETDGLFPSGTAGPFRQTQLPVFA
jgi:uncharacterized protein (DUF488 family)